MKTKCRWRGYGDRLALAGWQHGGQKADDMAMKLGVAWGGQVRDAMGAHLESLKQFPPRQKSGTLRMAGER